MNSEWVDNECDALVDLIDQCFAALQQPIAPLLELRDRIEQIPTLQFSDELSLEQDLERLTWRIRQEWFRANRAASDGFLKSPIICEHAERIRHVPPFSYERFGVESSVEARYASFRGAPPEGWQGAHQVFSSGMGAISSLLQTTCNTVTSEPIHLFTHSGYYETRRLFQLLDETSLCWHRFAATDQCFELEHGYKLLFIEPVRFDMELGTFDFDEFFRRWQYVTHPEKYIVVLDTTLSGELFQLSNILRAFTPKPALVVQVCSGLKLHQQGLELSNLGLLSCYFPVEVSDNERSPLAQRISNEISILKNVQGLGLSLDAASILRLRFVFDADQLTRFTRDVFQTNRTLAEWIETGGLFAKIAHPTNGSCHAWHGAPFVIFRLREASPEDLGLLLAVLAHEAKAQDLVFHHGLSFGFRSHRFDGFIPEDAGEQRVIRIAMGSRNGPSARKIGVLCQELAAIPDFFSLRERYPELKPLEVVIPPTD